MNREQRLHYLIDTLLAEKPRYAHPDIPQDADRQALLLRSLMNLREPKPVTPEFLRIQDEELSFQREAKGVVRAEALSGSPAASRLCLWQGDITRLAADCIVNASNNRMLGCFIPLHSCIDNAIHSAAGVQMRLDCAAQMRKLHRNARTAEVLMTPGYNLPARYVLHVTGPIVAEGTLPTDLQREELAACYTNCLTKAESKEVTSIAFCCISTGVFRFPPAEAATIAVRTVQTYLSQHPRSSIRKVIFNVFKDEDLYIYQQLLANGLPS